MDVQASSEEPVDGSSGHQRPAGRGQLTKHVHANAHKLKTWACRSCQTRKIKCDGAKPFCSTCLAHKRNCEYDERGPKMRSRVPGSRRDELARRRKMENVQAGAGESEDPSSQVDSPVTRSSIQDRSRAESTSSSVPTHYDTASHDYLSPRASQQPREEFEADVHGHGKVDVRAHLSLDKSGDILVRGPTNTLYESGGTRDSVEQEIPDRYASAMLTANSAMERQREVGYREILLARGEIEGVPAELALHLLDIHWARHHFFHLSYRPTFYRDMMCNGPYYSPLLFYAILAVSSRYSERQEVGGGDHAVDSGREYYKKAKELLVDEMDKSSIPTASALLLMGNALVNAGQVDRGWLYTGMGIRMIINLGLHIDINQAPNSKKKRSLEDIEIRKRVFWGAFISEKLQSLYLGRPVFIHKRDVHVPKSFLDVYEEGEAWLPLPNDGRVGVMTCSSVTSFASNCKLSEICGDIIGGFYAVKSKIKSSTRLQNQRDDVRRRLSDWLAELPENLKFTPWSSEGQKIVPIHVILIHTIYLSLVILLERPFVADGHLISDAEHMGSWVDCTIAAEKIAHLLHSYRESYTFRRVPYQLCYATYVASTILVRNAKNLTGRSASVQHLAICLKAFEEMKIAHPGTARMEAVIRSLMQRLSVNLDAYYSSDVPAAQSSVSNPTFLPSPNFNTSPTAVENRNFDLDIIRQSFAPPLITQPVSEAPVFQEAEASYAYDNSTSNRPLSDGFSEYQMADLGSADMGVDPAGNFPDLNWNMYAEGLDNDLLFGVLGDNWH